MTTAIQMAKELVTESITSQGLTPEEALALLRETHATLMHLEQGAVPAEAPAAAVQPTDWRRSITKQTIACLECGAPFRQLGLRHLSTHGLTPQSYRVKYRIPKKQALSAREITARRRQLARSLGAFGVDLNPEELMAKPTLAQQLAEAERQPGLFDG